MLSCFTMLALFLYPYYTIKKIKTLSKTTGRIGLKGTNWSLVGLGNGNRISESIQQVPLLQWLAGKC